MMLSILLDQRFCFWARLLFAPRAAIDAVRDLVRATTGRKIEPFIYSPTAHGIGAALGTFPVQEKSTMRTFIVVMSAVTALFSSPGLTQQQSQGTASIPDFSGIWAYAYWPGFEPPASGPGPVVNKLRRKQALDPDGRPLLAANAPLVSEPLRLVGDYSNPILKPHAAEVVKKHGEMELNGGAPTPSNQC
jgi:hypothetical protein